MQLRPLMKAARALVIALLVSGTASASQRVEREAITRALHYRDYSYALSLANHAAARWPKTGWPDYERGVALHHLGRTDEAVQAFARAEGRPATDRNTRAIAMYGRARALDDAGRCAEAQRAYEQYAQFVRAQNPKEADRAASYARACNASPAPNPALTAIASALMDRNYERALNLADKAATTEDTAWLDYDRGSALAGLGKIDEAVQAFQRAEQRFSQVGQGGVWGQSLAIWGAARTLANANRCNEAQQTYNRYAALVQPYDPQGAHLAIASSQNCPIGPGITPKSPLARRAHVIEPQSSSLRENQNGSIREN